MLSFCFAGGDALNSHRVRTEPSFYPKRWTWVCVFCFGRVEEGHGAGNTSSPGGTGLVSVDFSFPETDRSKSCRAWATQWCLGYPMVEGG